MKKLFFFFILFVALTAIACKQPTGSNQPGSESQETVTPGWYLYTTNADSANPQKTYLYINTNGTIERAGSTQYEYTGSHLKSIQGQLSYTICRKNADGKVITFVSCESPTWENGNNEPNNISTCPYAEGEYLDINEQWQKQGYGTYVYFYWPVNKNLPLWSREAIEYFVTCSNDYGYINENNIFVVGSLLKAGDEIQFFVTIKKDAYNTSEYYCYVKFTENSDNNNNDNENNSSEITLPTGYEWWCFEDAYLNNGYENFYVLYFNGEATRNGIDSYEISEISPLYKNKTSAVNNYSGTKYIVTNLTRLPAWCH